MSNLLLSTGKNSRQELRGEGGNPTIHRQEKAQLESKNTTVEINQIFQSQLR